MDDLIAFIKARLDEDEAAAKAAAEISGAPWAAVGTGGDVRALRDVDNWTLMATHVDKTVAAHIARHDPARVLRDVAADRAILAEYERWIEGRGYQNGLEFAIIQRAAVWSDHPDYRVEWAPWRISGA